MKRRRPPSSSGSSSSSSGSSPASTTVQEKKGLRSAFALLKPGKRASVASPPKRRNTKVPLPQTLPQQGKAPMLLRAWVASVVKGIFLLPAWVNSSLQGSNKPLLWATLALCGLGLAMVFSASAREAALLEGNLLAYVSKQAAFMVAGWLGLVLTCRCSLQWVRNSVWPLAIITLLLLLATQLFGDVANGSGRWLDVAGLRFQPSELAKLTVVLLMAHGLSAPVLAQGWPKEGLKQVQAYTAIGSVLVGVAVLLGLIIKQPNLSLTIILGLTTTSLLFVGGLPLGWFAATIPTLAFAVYQLIEHTPYQKKRIVGWLNPWADASDSGLHLIQSLYALAFGGLGGSGFGHSVQKLFYLPFQYTDFIFSVLCEELGLPGVLLLVGLYAVIGIQGYRIAWQCHNRFFQLVAFGLTTVLLIQMVVNTYVATGLFPVTGVTLPLISFGGTSVVITLGLVGLLLRISKANHQQVVAL